MKQLNACAGAILVPLLLVAVATAAPARASVLYKYTTPTANETLAPATEVDMSLVGGSGSLTNTAGTVPLDTCTGSTLISTVTSNGTPAANLSIIALTWVGCAEPRETTVPGEIEISNIAGTTNGTLTLRKTIYKVTTTMFEAICEYTVGGALDLGTLVGAKSSTGKASIQINTVVPATNSFFCPDARWKADYSVTSPLGLTIES